MTSVRVAGHFGELLQGRLGPSGPVALVSLPCPALWVEARQAVGNDFHGLVSPAQVRTLRERLDLPPAPPRPCDSCAAPCLTACPAGALTGAGYDVPACHAFLDTEPGRPCMTGGCLVRRACPLSAGYARLAEQSAYHMSRFHKAGGTA